MREHKRRRGNNTSAWSTVQSKQQQGRMEKFGTANRQDKKLILSLRIRLACLRTQPLLVCPVKHGIFPDPSAQDGGYTDRKEYSYPLQDHLAEIKILRPCTRLAWYKIDRLLISSSHDSGCCQIQLDIISH